MESENKKKFRKSFRRYLKAEINVDKNQLTTDKIKENIKNFSHRK